MMHDARSTMSATVPVQVPVRVRVRVRVRGAMHWLASGAVGLDSIEFRFGC